MAALAGVKTIKNLRGEVTHITIDVKKHKDKMGKLKEMGLVPKSKFIKEWDDAIANGAKTVAQSEKDMLKYIKELWKK